MEGAGASARQSAQGRQGVPAARSRSHAGGAAVSATPMVEIDRLAKNFGAETAVRGVDLAVAPGEFVTLLGPSGCGKTTTLRCIAGLEKANGGEIVVAGKKVFSAADNSFVPAYRRPIG